MKWYLIIEIIFCIVYGSFQFHHIENEDIKRAVLASGALLMIASIVITQEIDRILESIQLQGGF